MLHADVSDLVVECCLTQKDKKRQFKPIDFSGENLSRAQRALPNIEK